MNLLLSDNIYCRSKGQDRRGGSIGGAPMICGATMCDVMSRLTATTW